jgi:hypothetical protein
VSGFRQSSKKSGKQPRAGIPGKIRILREEGYHTQHIGRYNTDKQFMAFIVGMPLDTRTSRASQTIRWYAVIHRFDADGNHLGTEATFLGEKPFLKQLSNAKAKFAEMLAQLGPVTYCSVEIKLFSVRIDGHTFGLIDASEPEEEYLRVDLVPNALAFFPPWDGTYDT